MELIMLLVLLMIFAFGNSDYLQWQEIGANGWSFGCFQRVFLGGFDDQSYFYASSGGYSTVFSIPKHGLWKSGEYGNDYYDELLYTPVFTLKSSVNVIQSPDQDGSSEQRAYELTLAQ